MAVKLSEKAVVKPLSEVKKLMLRLQKAALAKANADKQKKDLEAQIAKLCLDHRDLLFKDDNNTLTIENVGKAAFVNRTKVSFEGTAQDWKVIEEDYPHLVKHELASVAKVKAELDKNREELEALGVSLVVEGEFKVSLNV